MIKAILTDIEGTTTAVSFVYDILFPYFNEHIHDLSQLLDHEQVKDCFSNIKTQIQPDDMTLVSDDQVIAQLKQWVQEDKKETNLKTLQGVLWKKAYENGEIKGHIYEDVSPALQEWKEQGLSLNVYSSGSVPAQKLLFGFSVEGDLTPLFDQYFDTNVGHKRESKSYQAITKALELSADEILFLSDIKEELDAAEQSGMKTLQLVRPGTTPANNHKQVATFAQIDLNALG